MATYRILDEPLPGPRDRAVVSPNWPLFSIMFAGPWLSWPWFLFNAWAMKSPRLGRNIAWVVLGLFGTALLVMGTVAVAGSAGAPRWITSYLLIAIVIWKLLVTYALTMDQSRSFELHQYFGGRVANGTWVFLLGSFYVTRLLGERVKAIESDFVQALVTWVLL